MNKHFEDARYYLKRAAETAKRGVKEELEPLRQRIERVAGTESEETDESRVEKLRDDLRELENRAEGEAKDAIYEARGKLKAYRES